MLQLPVCRINSLLGLTYYPIDQTYPPAAAFSVVAIRLAALIFWHEGSERTVNVLCVDFFLFFSKSIVSPEVVFEIIIICISL